MALETLKDVKEIYETALDSLISEFKREIKMANRFDYVKYDEK